MRSAFALVLSLALPSLMACDKKGAEPAVATAPTTSAPAAKAPTSEPAPAAAAKVSDPQIAAIVVAANQVDIDAGQLALQKSKNEEVRKLAQQMVTDHTAVNKAAVDLVTKLAVTPEETDASRGLVAGGKDNLAKLGQLEGDAFDRAYVDNEVAYHKAVIGVLDSLLIPSATNAELKATLVGVKPAFDAHLKHAEAVAAGLSGGGGATGHPHGQ
jgi:putative membrane protein